MKGDGGRRKTQQQPGTQTGDGFQIAGPVGPTPGMLQSRVGMPWARRTQGLRWSRGSPLSHLPLLLLPLHCSSLWSPGKGCLAWVSILLQRCRGLGWLMLVSSCFRIKPILCFIKVFFPSPRKLFVENSLGLEKQLANSICEVDRRHVSTAVPEGWCWGRHSSLYVDLCFQTSPV